jgi:lipopolysaccharide export system protein LptA
MNSTFLKVLLLFLFALVGGAPLLAQKTVELKQAKVLKGARTPEGEQFQKLIGDVVLEQNQTTIYCDSAYLYKNRNFVEAFGKVRITEGDSITITGKKLEYDGNAKVAKLRQDVVFTKLATATLYTDILDYDRVTNMATYIRGGRLVDSLNVLTSKKGYYNSNTNMASFKREVEVKNPDYTMYADSMQYNSRTNVIFFRTPTTVVGKDSSSFVYNLGEYDTKTKESIFESGYGESAEYKIKSDYYELDDLRKIYKTRGNVVMTSKKENLLIYGQSADYYKEKGLSKVYNNAYLAKVTDQDTLFMSADTLISIENEDPKKKRLLAYHHVKVYRPDMRGLADSVEYRSADSTIYFYKDPILWSEGNQMTADSISMLIKNNNIDRIFLKANAFVISRDTLINFNQIKGRKMEAKFRSGKINEVVVTGNGESVYFALQENKKDSVDAKAMGLNKIICSDITIRFSNGQVNNLTFFKKPDAQFIPPHEMQEEDKRLPGFDWREDEKPERKDVVKAASPQKKLPPPAKPSGKRPVAKGKLLKEADR